MSIYGVVSAGIVLISQTCFSSILYAASPDGEFKNFNDSLEWLRKQKAKPAAKPRECKATPGPLPDGYRVYPIVKMEYFHCSNWVSQANRDCLEGQLEIANGRIAQSSPWDVITNGSFCASDDSLGAIMREGRVEVTGAKSAWRRGGIAVLEGGKVVGCDMRSIPFTVNRDLAMVRLQRECSPDGERVVSLMGGGTLLLHKGNRVSEANVISVQKMSALTIYEHRFDNHVVVAVRNGKGVLVLAKDNAATIQKNLCAAGYDSGVKFDGGSPYSVRTRSRYNSALIPCSGIKVRTH